MGCVVFLSNDVEKLLDNSYKSGFEDGVKSKEEEYEAQIAEIMRKMSEYRDIDECVTLMPKKEVVNICLDIIANTYFGEGPK